ncbi:MAG: pyruvate kinase [Patescibacteria group bacterium]|jgi:pyruvate kinase
MRTKIVASVGPATESEETIKKLIEAGMGVMRLNFSHDVHEAHGQRIDTARKIAAELGKDIEVLCDLQGPKIRVREFPHPPLMLYPGDMIALTTSSNPDIKPMDLVIEDPYLHEDVKPGDPILMDDGQIELVAERVENHRIYSKVIVGGELYPRKGVNLPYTQTTTSSLTEKDIKDLEFILTKNPDWVAISFVQSAHDVERVKELIGDRPVRVMCKIERAKAISNLSEIIDAADGVMVARGDLGVEIPIEKLPIIQKQIIKRANYADKPVVTATQMLSTMTHNPFPTRAEVSDIANAIFDGTDAVMLSNETAVGEYPVKAVEMMTKVIRETENYLFNRDNKL